MSSSVETAMTGPSSPRSTASQTAVDHTIVNRNDDLTKTTSSSLSQSNGSKINTQRGSKFTATAIPRDKIRLDVLLISGNRKFFFFEPSSSVKIVRERIWEEWPQDWPVKPTSRSSIRILHLGHILDDKAILCASETTCTTTSTDGGKKNDRSASVPAATSAGAMWPGQSYVVHLLIRQEQGKSSKENEGSGDTMKKANTGDADDSVERGAGCCCVVC